MLLLPEGRSADRKIIPGNAAEIVILAKKLKTIGLDYFVIKPYSHQPLSLTKIYKYISYKNSPNLEKNMSEIVTDNFEIIFRARSMQKYSAKRSYNRCLAIPFSWAYIMADGSVYSCSAYLFDKRFYLGNINQQSFKEIWEGKKRQAQWEFMRHFNPKNCRKNCVMDRVNEHLWEIINPPYNVNFI